MPARIAFELADGGTVFIEAPGGSGVSPAGRNHLERASATLRESLNPVIGVAADVFKALSELPAGPEEVEVQFGVVLDATVGAVIVTGTAGAHLDVTLHWKPRAAEAEGAAPEPRKAEK